MNLFWQALLANSNEIRNITNVGESLAYTWFGRPNWAYSETAQKYWIGTTKDIVGGTTQHVTEYNIINDTYTNTRVGTVFQKNDHNQSQILIRQSDNRLIAFYVEHSGSLLRWKISTNSYDSTSWGSEKNYNPVSAYSYISPYQASNGDIFMFFRSTISAGTYKWYYVKSIDNAETFGPPVTFFDNGPVQAYLISYQNGDKLHFTASNGHPNNDPTLNISVYHFYFDLLTATSHKTDGTSILLPLDVSKLTTVTLTSGNDTSWILDVVCKNNLPRIIYTFYPEGRVNNWILKELWFVEWNGLSWVNKQKISQTLNGYIEDDANVSEKAYSGASRFDTFNPDIIWMPKQVNGILEIHKVDLRNSPIYIEQLTFDSLVNNWRPISVPGEINNLLWLKNNFYNYYTNYSISLQAKTVSTD